MPLPAAWVDALFARLTVRYGAAFMRQYADIALDAVKADWADVLGGLADQPDAIRYGLEHLPTDRPINAMQFRAICNGRPAPALPALTNDVRAEPEKVAALVAAIKTPERSNSRAWARALRDREQGGERLSVAQRDAWRTALADDAGRDAA